MTLVTEKRWIYEDYLKLEDDKRYEITVGKLYMAPAPDLVVEIVSTSSQYRDTFEKKELYERFKVKEYWIVNPYMKGIEVLAPDDKGRYTLFSEGYMEEGKNKSVKSKVMDGFELDLGEVFKEEF